MNFIISKLLSDWNVNFAARKTLGFALSSLLTLLTLILLLTRGINFGIDFTGGILIEIVEKPSIITQEIKNTLSSKFSSVTVQETGDKTLVIKIKSTKGLEDSELVKNLLAKYHFTYQKIDYVGPQISSSFIKKSVSALSFAIIGIFLYLSFAFNYRYGLGGVIALVHDVIIIFGVYSVLQIEFNISAIAAILTIVGYSINDSVVIFDRIRENTRKFDQKADLINFSINSTLSRTVLTSFTTLLAILPIIFLCTGEIKDFAIIIFNGVIIGTYSSIFIASFVAFPRSAN